MYFILRHFKVLKIELNFRNDELKLHVTVFAVVTRVTDLYQTVVLHVCRLELCIGSNWVLTIR